LYVLVNLLMLISYLLDFTCVQYVVKFLIDIHIQSIGSLQSNNYYYNNIYVKINDNNIFDVDLIFY